MNCEKCINYSYDEYSGTYCCLVDLDEDEMMRFLSGANDDCPYFRLDDEYGVEESRCDYTNHRESLRNFVQF